MKSFFPLPANTALDPLPRNAPDPVILLQRPERSDSRLDQDQPAIGHRCQCRHLRRRVDEDANLAAFDRRDQIGAHRHPLAWLQQRIDLLDDVAIGIGARVHVLPCGCGQEARSLPYGEDPGNRGRRCHQPFCVGRFRSICWIATDPVAVPAQPAEHWSDRRSEPDSGALKAQHSPAQGEALGRRCDQIRALKGRHREERSTASYAAPFGAGCDEIPAELRSF